MNLTMIKDELLEAEKCCRLLLLITKFATYRTSGDFIGGIIQKDGKVLACGNGGSHCDAMHFAEELTGRYREHRPSYPAIAISDPSHLSCVANDYGYNFVFSRYLEGVGRAGDVLFCLSTSGNSANILEAINTPKERDICYCLNR